MGFVLGLGNGIVFRQGGSQNWSSYWATLISATVENAAPTHVVLTFPTAQSSLGASNFTIAGFTVSSASWTDAVLTLVLAETVAYNDSLIITFVPTGETHAVANNLTATVARYATLGSGALVCWNMPTMQDVEYSKGDLDPDTFAPTDLDVDQWITTIKASGMKYAMLTVKHHDGFCLWPTAWAESGYDPYSIAQTAWYAANGSPDVTKLFIDACRANDIKPCIYYSIWDLTHEIRSGTTEVTDAAAYIAMIKAQLDELLLNYGYIHAVWFDGWGWHIGFDDIPYATIYDYIKSISPNTLVINNCQEHPTTNSEIEVYEFEPPFIENITEGEEVKSMAYWAPGGTNYRWFHSDLLDNTVTGYKSALDLVGQKRRDNARSCNYLIGVAPDKTGHIPTVPAAILTEMGTLVEDSSQLVISLHSWGTGVGVGTLKLWSNADITMTIDGAGKFYDDSGGTTNEGTTRTITAGAVRTFYVKVTGGQSNIQINNKTHLIGIGSTKSGWDSSTNAPYFVLDLSELPSSLQYFYVHSRNFVRGSTASIPDATIFFACYGTNSVHGLFSTLPANMYQFYCYGENTIADDFDNLPAAMTNLDFEGSRGQCSYTQGHSFNANMNRFRYNPSTGYYPLTATEVSDLVKDLSVPAWAGSTRYLILAGINPTMADTNQGGIWGDFDGETSPSALATAYKSLMKTKSVTVTLTGIIVPGASGDGTGFPAGFGDWYRS